MARRGNFWRWLVRWCFSPRGIAAFLGVIGLVILLAGYLYYYADWWPQSLYLAAGWEKTFEALWANVGTTLVGVTLVVYTVEWAGERRAEQQLKAQLIREMGSPDNGIALRAVRELRAHGWLEDGSLRWADLSRADLRGALLEGALLEGVNLQEANLQGAKLEGADLREANLRKSKLDRVNLFGANLREAKLREADLQGATLLGADLQGASLWAANLQGAHLQGANLEGANLEGANLQECQLTADDLKGAKSYGATMPDGSKHP